MSKKLYLNKETLRLLASTDPFEAIATDQTAQIVGGHRKPAPQPKATHSVCGPCPPGQKG